MTKSQHASAPAGIKGVSLVMAQGRVGKIVGVAVFWEGFYLEGVVTTF